MSRTGRDSRKGNAIIEFTLVGIPVIFLLISIFEISRGMWIYVTVAHSIKEGLRYSIVHGNDCAIPPNSCRLQVRQIATRISQSAVGLVPSDFTNVQLISSNRTVTCTTLQACLSGGALGDTYWPTSAPGVATVDPGGVRGLDLEIRGSYRFNTALSMFWPGAGAVGPFGLINLGANAKERIQY
jgi:hypothetical protein